MRVIAGSARRHILVTLEGQNVRPTTDRIKETLFNMINNKVFRSTFLDLFSGSGAIGIEALSRGARKSVFIENNTQALNCIKQNLNHTKLSNQATVMKLDVKKAIELLSNQKIQFDIIFLDPPYNKGWEEEVISLIEKKSLCLDDGIIICESTIETNFDFLKNTQFKIIKEKKFHTNKFTFISYKDS